MPENKEKEEEKPVVAKTAIDLQRLKLQKLMKNPVNIKILKHYFSYIFIFFFFSFKQNKKYYTNHFYLFAYF